MRTIKYKPFDVTQVFLTFSQFTNASNDTRVILKDKVLNEKFA